MGLGEDTWKSLAVSAPGASDCFANCNNIKGCASARESRKGCERAFCMSDVDHTDEMALGLFGHCTVPTKTRKMKKENLGKRELDRVDCYYNATFVSEQCC
jgi:hypothetical protein